MHGNLQKYASVNVLQQLLIRRFLAAVDYLVKSTKASTILDTGCGEGFVSNNLTTSQTNLNVRSLDRDADALKRGRDLFPQLEFIHGNIESLPFGDGSFDAVLCLEVLEHNTDPSTCIREIRRVSRRYCIFSVPHEPFFHLANFLRFKHVRAWGNDPEHINHWNTRTFGALLKKNRFRILETLHPFPWLLFLCEKEGGQKA